MASIRASKSLNFCSVDVSPRYLVVWPSRQGDHPRLWVLSLIDFCIFLLKDCDREASRFLPRRPYLVWWLRDWRRRLHTERAWLAFWQFCEVPWSPDQLEWWDRFDPSRPSTVAGARAWVRCCTTRAVSLFITLIYSAILCISWWMPSISGVWLELAIRGYPII